MRSEDGEKKPISYIREIYIPNENRQNLMNTVEKFVDELNSRTQIHPDWSLFVHEEEENKLNLSDAVNVLGAVNEVQHFSQLHRMPDVKIVYGEPITASDVADMRKFLRCCITGFHLTGCSGVRWVRFFEENNWDVCVSNASFKCFHKTYPI